MGKEMKADVQYGDAEGTAALDWNGPNDLFEFFRKLKIDTEKFRPVGISIYFGERDFFMSIYVKEQNQNKNSKGEYPLKEFHTDIKLKDFLGYAKRLNIVLYERGIDENDYYVDKSIDLSELQK